MAEDAKKIGWHIEKDAKKELIISYIFDPKDHGNKWTIEIYFGSHKASEVYDIIKLTEKTGGTKRTPRVVVKELLKKLLKKAAAQKL